MIADAPSILTFDAARHEYFIRGERVPSVTQVLKLCGFINERWFNERATERGTRVAEATELDDRDDLDPESIDDEIMVYVEAWRRFRRETKFEILTIEEPVCHPSLGYAGKLDRRGMLLGKHTIVDIKTGGKAPWHPLQTAGYAIPIDHEKGTERACVYLRDDGTYRLEKHEDYNDLSVFPQCVAVARQHMKFGAMADEHDD